MTEKVTQKSGHSTGDTADTHPGYIRDTRGPTHRLCDQTPGKGTGHPDKCACTASVLALPVCWRNRNSGQFQVSALASQSFRRSCCGVCVCVKGEMFLFYHSIATASISFVFRQTVANTSGYSRANTEKGKRDR